MTVDIKKIDTSKYTTSGKVEIDGHIWEVVLPGAGRELQLSKNQRRGEFLTKKIEKGDATEEDLDKMDAIEDFMVDFFTGIFRDGTKDNSEVKAWVDATPLAVIGQAFEDIKKQAEASDVNG